MEDDISKFLEQKKRVKEEQKILEKMAEKLSRFEETVPAELDRINRKIAQRNHQRNYVARMSKERREEFKAKKREAARQYRARKKVIIAEKIGTVEKIGIVEK